ncbi:hypothetical protein RUND412_010889, partial [Rhizina undulata]
AIFTYTVITPNLQDALSFKLDAHRGENHITTNIHPNNWQYTISHSQPNAGPHLHINFTIYQNYRFLGFSGKLDTSEFELVTTYDADDE